MERENKKKAIKVGKRVRKNIKVDESVHKLYKEYVRIIRVKGAEKGKRVFIRDKLEELFKTAIRLEKIKKSTLPLPIVPELATKINKCIIELDISFNILNIEEGLKKDFKIKRGIFLDHITKTINIYGDNALQRYKREILKKLGMVQIREGFSYFIVFEDYYKSNYNPQKKRKGTVKKGISFNNIISQVIQKYTLTEQNIIKNKSLIYHARRNIRGITPEKIKNISKITNLTEEFVALFMRRILKEIREQGGNLAL